MSLRFGMRNAGLRGRARSEGVGASAYAPYSAPEGYRWEFVYDDGELVTDQGEPVVDLVEIT